MLVAGVDGCRRGWLVVRAEPGTKLRLERDPFIATFQEIIEQAKDCVAVGVDIPIGLSEAEPLRAPDRAAKDALGWPRMTSVFAAPVRATLVAALIENHRESYAQARALSFEACGKKMSCFAHGILKKVAEANQAMSPMLQDQIVEVHPEVCFWAMNDQRAMKHSKKKPAGLGERLELLSQWFEDELASVAVPSGAGRDDFFDACAAAWSAWRFATGRHRTLPDEPQTDSRGLRMEIVY